MGLRWFVQRQDRAPFPQQVDQGDYSRRVGQVVPNAGGSILDGVCEGPLLPSTGPVTGPAGPVLDQTGPGPHSAHFMAHSEDAVGRGREPGGRIFSGQRGTLGPEGPLGPVQEGEETASVGTCAVGRARRRQIQRGGASAHDLRVQGPARFSGWRGSRHDPRHLGRPGQVELSNTLTLALRSQPNLILQALDHRVPADLGDPDRPHFGSLNVAFTLRSSSVYEIGRSPMPCRTMRSGSCPIFQGQCPGRCSRSPRSRGSR